MAQDMEALAKALLGSAAGAKVSADLDKYKKILATPRGREVVDALMRDGGQGLKKAAADARAGNMETARQVLSSVASTKEGAEILRRILDAASE